MGQRKLELLGRIWSKRVIESKVHFLNGLIEICNLHTIKFSHLMYAIQ